MGPKLKFNFNFLDMGNIFIGSKQSYKVPLNSIYPGFIFIKVIPKNKNDHPLTISKMFDLLLQNT